MLQNTYVCLHARGCIHTFYPTSWFDTSNIISSVWQAFLRGESLPFNAYDLSQLVDMSSSMAQEANVLEREVTNYWLAHYFRAQKESNPQHTWKATLLMWMRTVSAVTPHPALPVNPQPALSVKPQPALTVDPVDPQPTLTVDSPSLP